MNIERIVEEQRKYFYSGATIDVLERKKNLKHLLTLLYAYKEQFVEALNKDFNKSRFEAIETEFLMIVNECKFMIKNIKKLTKRKTVKVGLANFPGKGYLLQEPYGVVLIMAPWNYPLQLALEPVFGAIAAGNTVVIKPANYAQNTSRIIYEMFKEFNKPELISVVLGGREENQTLLDQRFDYIFFTGGTTVGRMVLDKAKKYITPVTLELGGKSPCIVDENADLNIAVKRIVWGKFLNAGQTCVAPDYVLVHEKIYEEFISRAIEQVKANYYTNDKLRDDFPHLINQKHFDKVYSLIDTKKIVWGGKSNGVCLEPTILRDISFTDAIMQEEIFGPIMPIIKYENLNEILQHISRLEKPLAFYFFTKNIKLAHHVMNQMSFGGGCINDTIMHLTGEHLPFGGVGNSGMGQYHGKKSFETFSHQKSVLLKGKLEISLKYPPYTKKKEKFLQKML